MHSEIYKERLNQLDCVAIKIVDFVISQKLYVKWWIFEKLYEDSKRKHFSNLGHIQKIKKRQFSLNSQEDREIFVNSIQVFFPDLPTEVIIFNVLIHFDDDLLIPLESFVGFR